MRVLVQRASEASVLINNDELQQIGQGLVVLVGIEGEDGVEDVSWLVSKVCSLRIFGDEEGKMNRSLLDIKGELLIISQFTLHASTKKGNRPSYIQAAKPEVAIPLYEHFISLCEKQFPNRVKTGKFGADMKVSLVNDGPVTIWMDSKNRE